MTKRLKKDENQIAASIVGQIVELIPEKWNGRGQSQNRDNPF